MATTLTAPLHAGKTFTARFKNDVDSTGVVLLTAGWVPKNAKLSPKSRGLAIAPGGEKGFKGEVLKFSEVRRLSITVSLDAGEFGVLEVREDGKEHTTEDVTETTTFEMPVDP